MIAPLGAGGMGEVYRAKDTRLERTVAIKVLPAHVAADPDRRARFEREAKTVSALSHPHICGLFDIGEQDGITYLVMEHLEGETLAQRLDKGPLPFDQVLRLGMEIAAALARAHKQGIVHRDLKPANVMLTKSGAKLLDFGLAKAFAASGDGRASVLATATHGEKLTAEGTIVGTFQYMSPEQLEGKDADARSDIWALGCVLYEMAAGQTAFTGKSRASLISAILKDEPAPVSSVRPMTPAALDRIVRKCLAKDPDERWESARDLVEELRWIAEAKAAAPASPSGPSSTRLSMAAAGVVVLVLVAGLAGFRLGRGRAPVARGLVRLVTALPSGQSLWLGRGSALILSPDGRRLVYLATEGGTTRLYARPLDRLEPTPLGGTEGADSPFFSPDGEWVGFFAAGKLRKVPVAGGPASTLCDAPDGRGGAWAPDDTIVFAPGNFSGLSRVPATGGQPKALTAPDRPADERSHRWPQVLPGGKAVLFTIGIAGGTSFDAARIAIASLETGQVRLLSERGFYARYVPSGHLFFLRGSTLLAAPFDAQRQELRGAPVPAMEGVRTNASGGAHIALSNAGSIAYVPGGTLETERTMVFVDREGRAQAISDMRRDFLSPRLSPDGQRIAVSVRTGTVDIWVYDLTRATLMRLTSGPAGHGGASWTADSQRVAYFSWTPGQGYAILWKPADGSGPEERLLATQGTLFSSVFSPDGRFLVYDERGPQSSDINVLPLSGDRKPRPLLNTPANEGGPAFSPDGRWLAYHSDESGRDEVYVKPFPGLGPRWQVSNQGGSWPLWARNGRELFYRREALVTAVAVETGATFRAGSPRPLVKGNYLAGIYDVTADGRFLLVRPTEEGPPPTQFNVELEWLSDLARRVPVP